MEDLINLGYFGLFIAAFFSSTVLPFSFFSMMLVNDYNFTLCLVFATTGNWLAGVMSYYLGYLGKWTWIEKYFRVQIAKVILMKQRVDKYGSCLAFLSGVPFIPEVVPVALGFFRITPLTVFPVMFAGKFVRYLVIGIMVVKSIALIALK